MAEQGKTTTKWIPPQFAREDILIYLAWKDEMEKRYSKIEYNVVLGGDKGGPEEEKVFSDMWKRLTARRVDAVGYAEDHTALIEFRKFAGPSAIGQLIMYKSLWEREKDISKPIKLILVTDIATDPIITTAKNIGIELIIVTQPREEP